MPRILSPEAQLEHDNWQKVFSENKLKQPYTITFHRREGWSQYKGLRHARVRGWWKDYGYHELARKMVKLGLPDAPVQLQDHEGSPSLTFASLYWMAEHDITENDAGISYYKHNNNPMFADNDE